MASEVVFSGMDKIGRMTLMDPGRIVKTFKVNGKDQIGFYNKVRLFYSSRSLFIFFKKMSHLSDICIIR